METIGPIDMRILLPSNNFTWLDTSDNDTNNNNIDDTYTNCIKNSKKKKKKTRTATASSNQLSVRISKVIAEKNLLQTQPHTIKHLNDEKAKILRTHS